MAIDFLYKFTQKVRQCTKIGHLLAISLRLIKNIMLQDTKNKLCEHCEHHRTNLLIFQQ